MLEWKFFLTIFYAKLCESIRNVYDTEKQNINKKILSNDTFLLASGDTKQGFDAAKLPVFSTQRDWLMWRDVRTKGIYKRLRAPSFSRV